MIQPENVSDPDASQTVPVFATRLCLRPNTPIRGGWQAIDRRRVDEDVEADLIQH
jgi:hypothetical protein